MQTKGRTGGKWLMRSNLFHIENSAKTDVSKQLYTDFNEKLKDYYKNSLNLSKKFMSDAYSFGSAIASPVARATNPISK